MIIDPRISAMPGRSTSGVNRQGRHCFGAGGKEKEEITTERLRNGKCQSGRPVDGCCFWTGADCERRSCGVCVVCQNYPHFTALKVRTALKFWEEPSWNLVGTPSALVKRLRTYTPGGGLCCIAYLLIPLTFPDTAVTPYPILLYQYAVVANASSDTVPSSWMHARTHASIGQARADDPVFGHLAHG